MRTVLVALVAALAVGVSSAGAASAVGVSITKNGFSPKTATLDFGTKVTWTNNDTVNHQVVADNGAFASPILRPGKTYSFTFNESGTFRYHDALHPSLTGSFTVKGPPPSLSLALDKPIVVYGTPVTISGKATGIRVGSAVTIYAQPYGAPSPVQLAVVQAGSDGSFGFTTTPKLYTTYTASYQTTPTGPTVTSNAVIVQVEPKVQLLAGKKGYFRAQVNAGKPLYRHHVMLQRRSVYGQWVNLKALTIDSENGVLFRAAKFLPKGVSRIRISLSVNQAGIGLLGGTSGVQTIYKR